MLGLWCIFCPAHVRIAFAGYNEGLESLRQFAKAGNWGHAGKNLARDLMKSIMRDCTMPELFWYKIPTWDPESRKQVLTPHPLLLPHEMIHRLLSAKPDLFHVSAVDYPEISDLLDIQCAKNGLGVGRTAAVGLHGDGAPYTKKDSVEILSFNFLSCPTSDRVPVTAISKKFTCKCGCKGRHTWHGTFFRL